MAQKSFKRSKLTYDIYGTAVEIDKPKYGRLKQLEAQLKALPEEGRGQEAEKVIVEFMKELGIPGDLLMEMEMEHILEIADDITGKKKA